MISMVAVEMRGTDCFVSAYARIGMSDRQTGFLIRLKADVDAKSLGSAVLEALASPDDAPSIASQKSAAQAALKLRRYSAYLEGTVATQIEPVGNGQLRLVPMRNEGRHGGFSEITDLASIVDETDAEQLGRHVRECLALAI